MTGADVALYAAAMRDDDTRAAHSFGYTSRSFFLMYTNRGEGLASAPTRAEGAHEVRAFGRHHA